MHIKGKDTVVVFKLPNDSQFNSYVTGTKIMLEAGDLVAVYEVTSTLSYGGVPYKIKWSDYMNIVTYVNCDEMTHDEYMVKQRQYLNDKYPNAPVICTIDDANAPQSRGYQPNNTVNIGGITIKLQR